MDHINSINSIDIKKEKVQPKKGKSFRDINQINSPRFDKNIVNPEYL